MISLNLLQKVLNPNIVDIYRREADKTWRIKTKSEKDGWVSNSDVPLVDLEKLSFTCKRYAHKNGFRIDSNPASSKLSKKTELGWVLVDTVCNANFENPVLYDPMLDIMACEGIFN